MIATNHSDRLASGYRTDFVSVIALLVQQQKQNYISSIIIRFLIILIQSFPLILLENKSTFRSSDLIILSDSCQKIWFGNLLI